MNTLNPSQKMAARPRAGCLPGLFLLAGLLASVTPLRADNPPTYLFQIDCSGVPGGVALDSSNNVYVSLYGGIEKFSGSGTYLARWGQFDNPHGVALDSNGNVYVADSYNYQIEKFTSNGNVLTQWGSYGTGVGQFGFPNGVAVDTSNNVYVADENNDRIEKFSSNGTYLTQWGSSGSGNGQFDYPNGVAVDTSNNVYVADSGNNRIQKFDSNGNYLTQWGSYGTNNGQFDYLWGIALDGSNSVYVANGRTDGDYGVEKFSISGTFLTQWGSYGSGVGQFDSPPTGIAFDTSGNFIYVIDLLDSSIQVFVNDTNIIPPIITSQPASQTFLAAYPGIKVTFSVGVVGTAPFAYQWSSNNVAVPGATNATFTLTNASVSDSGGYSVLVTNLYGSALSSIAVLAIVPAFVTTQPASGMSATGAVLNGSATVGQDATLVWFDWGTDTNYGNIAGVTIVPGNNGSNNISAPLSGLPGNIYHYRLHATNDSGIVYGGDQFFTVGFAPTATTLPSTTGANGATLEATVNPEGWDTTIYFRWGTPTLTNTTPGMDIGAGATSLNVSSFVPGLAPSTPYEYQVVASNALGTAFGEVIYWGGGKHLFSGSKMTIILPPGTYIITAYGAPGGGEPGYNGGGLGAEMSAEFNFSTPTNLTLLVGGGGGVTEIFEAGGGGGGGSFVVEGSTPLVIAGGGGGNGRDYNGGGNGTVGTNGQGGGPYISRVYGPDGGAGGTNGGGGSGGTNLLGFSDYPQPIISGGGGGGFLGNGGDGANNSNPIAYSGGSSFETGGYGGTNGYPGGYSVYGNGGYGGGGAGGDAYRNAGDAGGGGGGGGYSGGGGGGIPKSNNQYGGGGGGGSIIDSSAIAILAEVSGITSPDDPTNGEIIIIAVPPPPLVIVTTNAAFGLTNGVFGFDVSGPSGSNVVIQASMDLQTWIPLQTNLLGSGPLYFSDAQSATNRQRFYRAQLSP